MRYAIDEVSKTVVVVVGGGVPLDIFYATKMNKTLKKNEKKTVGVWEATKKTTYTYTLKSVHYPNITQKTWTNGNKKKTLQK